VANWHKQSLRIKHLLTEEATSEATVKSAKGIVEQIKLRFPNSADSELDLIVDHFNDVKTVDQHCEAMELLYDWCDENLIWVD